MNKEKFIVLDSHSLIHRAYHAIPFLETKKGEASNAVYGFFSILIKVIQDFNPDYIAATFDFPAPTFRHEKFKEYKIKRPKAPDDLVSQIIKTKDTVRLLNIPVFEKKGFEADDVIGTISHELYNNENLKTIIVSGDMDNLQLINDKTQVFLLKRGIKEASLFDVEKIKEKYQGLSPQQLIDYKGLKGDSSDNIPGVPGVGDKTALNLISKFGSIENLYKEIENETRQSKLIKKGIKDKIIEFQDKAFFSKELIVIEKNVPIDFSLNNCRWQGFNEGNIKEIFSELGFHSLLKRIAKIGSEENNLTLF